MVRWDLTDNEYASLKSFLSKESRRLDHVIASTPKEGTRVSSIGKQQEITHLLSALRHAKLTADGEFDVCCYCDTNYEYMNQTTTVSYRIGDEQPQHRAFVTGSRPDEYVGILQVLETLKERKVTGRVRLISDAARCVIALQKGLKYTVPKHSDNQAPRAVDYRGTYDVVLNSAKELRNSQCQVEFDFRNRAFINEALSISKD